MSKKRVMKWLIIVCILIMAVNRDITEAVAEEVIIESIIEENVNPWDNRPLIQTTSSEDEYLGAVELGAFTMPELKETDSEKLYDEASKCVVRIVMGQYAGSGLIWRMEKDGMVLVANKHLLKEAAYATVTFSNGDELPAELLGFSPSQDIGFLMIKKEVLTADVLRECYQVRMYEDLVETIGTGELEDMPVVQIGSSIRAATDTSEGKLLEKRYIPEFQSDMLVTECYARAGMSGGGVFDAKGRLLSMIAGGDVKDYASVRESQITYSIAAEDIEKAYELIFDF